MALSANKSIYKLIDRFIIRYFLQFIHAFIVSEIFNYIKYRYGLIGRTYSTIFIYKFTNSLM